MCYILTNGCKYIQKLGNQYAETNNILNAFKLTSEKSAINFRDLNINNPIISKGYYPVRHIENELNLNNIKGREKSENSYYKVLAEIGNSFSELLKNEEELKEELSQCDLSISDVYHNIEFHEKKLTQKQAQYLVNEILKPILVKRRKIKDSLLIINSIKTNIQIKGLSTVMDKIEEMDNRIYTYKVLDL